MGRDHEEKFSYFGHFSNYPSALQPDSEALCEMLQLKEYPVWRWVADVGLSVLSCEKSKRLTPLFGGRHPPSLCLPVSGWNDEWPGETQSGDIIELLGCEATLSKEEKTECKWPLRPRFTNPFPRDGMCFEAQTRKPLSSGDRGNRSCLFNCSRKHLQ